MIDIKMKKLGRRQDGDNQVSIRELVQQIMEGAQKLRESTSKATWKNSSTIIRTGIALRSRRKTWTWDYNFGVKHMHYTVIDAILMVSATYTSIKYTYTEHNKLVNTVRVALL
jgi:hypothetical protein